MPQRPPNGTFNFLTPNFLNGATKGQINAIYRDRDRIPERVVEYRQALALGYATLTTPMAQGDGTVSHQRVISNQQAYKLREMQIPIPVDVEIGVPRKPRPPKRRAPATR